MSSYYRLGLALLAGLALAALMLVILPSAQAQPEQPETGRAVNILDDETNSLPLEEPDSLPIGIWLTETVDSVGDVGQYTSLELDSGGYPHVSYYDVSNGDLKYAYQNASGWHFETVDSDGGRHSSLELDSTGNPHISYLGSNGSLKFAERISNWQIQVVDNGVVLHSSLALDANGNPHIGYLLKVDQTFRNLKFATRVGGWTTQVVDQNIRVNCGLITPEGAEWPSLQFTNNNMPTITYARCEQYYYHEFRMYNLRLKRAYSSGGSWSISTLDSGYSPLPPYSNVGCFPSHVYDTSNQLHVSYQKCSSALKYYGPNGGMTGASGTGSYTAIALDGSGYALISHYGGSNLKFTYRDASGWHTQDVDTVGDVGKYTSLGIDSEGAPLISYYDASNGNLRLARYNAHGVFLLPFLQSKSGNRGETVSYQLTLYNMTGTTDSFSLEPGAHNWDVQITPNPVGPIPDGTTATVIVSVTVPPDAPWHQIESIELIARSIHDPSLISLPARTDTTAYAPPQISVTPQTMSATQYPNSVTTQTLTIANGLGVTLTFNAGVSDTSNGVLDLHLDESLGSDRFLDSSGWGNHGTCSGSSCPLAGVPGMQSTAVDFDGVDDYISIPHSANFDIIEDEDRVTIAAWIKIRDWMENVFPIIDIDEAANDFGWAFEVHPGGVFFFTGEYVAAACAFVPDLQEWYHLAVTYDRGAGTVTFYINGNVACQSNYSEDIEDTVGDPIYVGWSKAGPDEYSNGVIDELVVFDRALTLPEIQALYHGSGGGTGWLSIHPNSGTVPTNSSVPLQATSDSTDLQPAVYPGNISIFSNDPLHSLVQVPVTMTVLPTPSMGWVEGTVTDLRSSDPMVASISAAGQPYTVTSSLPNGRYRLWLEPGAYELHVSAPGYIAQTRMVDIQTQQGATQDFSLLLDAPWLQSSPESLASTQAPGAITTQTLMLTNIGSVPLDYQLNGGVKSVSFLAAATELYGYAVPGAWLRVIGLWDDTEVEVIDLDAGQMITYSLDLDRYEIWDVYPGAYYKVIATKPVVGYASDFNGYGHLTFVPSTSSGPVGNEFIFYFHCGDTVGDYCYVFAIEDAQVDVYDPSGALIASQQLQAGNFWQLALPNGVYRIVSTGRIEIEISAEDSYSTVPSVVGASTGYQFYFATHFQESGAFAVFAYQDAQINVYDLENGALLYSHTLNRGEYWLQTDVYLKKLRLESTGLVEVWAGATEGGTSIENLGDDISMTTGNGGLEFYTHSLMEGSILFAPFEDTTVDIDGVIYQLSKDDYLHLSGCFYYRHIIANRPVLIETLGGDSGWNSTGTYLGGVVTRGDGFPDWLSAIPLSGTLQSNQSQAIAVTFDANGVMPGTYTTTLEIISNDPRQPLVQVPVTMTVLGEGIWLVPEGQAQVGTPGSVVTYTVGLYNITPLTDTYALTLAGNAWPVSLPPTPIGPLEPGMHQDLKVSVAIPPEANWYATDTVVVTATSMISPTEYYASAQLTTQAYAPPQISVLPAAVNSIQYLGQVSTRTLTISNGFGVTLSFTATLPGTISWLRVEPDSGEVTTNSSAPIQVTLDATGLQPSIYSTYLLITSNDPERPLVYVPVMMVVLPLVPTAVTLSGPETGIAGHPYTFTGEVLPISATLPIQYTWQASGQAPQTHTGGLSDTVTFSWMAPGTQVITVTASNSLGGVVDTHTINIADELISGLAASNDSPTFLGTPTTFSATLESGSNIVYTWDFGDGTGGSGAVAAHTYAAAGVYTATVTASNSASQASASTQATVVDADHRIYLPLIPRQPDSAEAAAAEAKAMPLRRPTMDRF